MAGSIDSGFWLRKALGRVGVRNWFATMFVLVALVLLATIGCCLFSDGVIFALISEKEADALYYLGNAFATGQQIRDGSTSILQVLRKEISIPGIYWPFGRYVTGVDVDLPFLMLVLASLAVPSSAAGMASAFNSVVMVHVILNCASIFVTTKRLGVSSNFIGSAVSVAWMAFPFFHEVVKLGHLGFLPFWPLVLTLGIAAETIRGRKVSAAKAVIAGLLLYVAAYSSLQYAYFVTLAVAPILAVALVVVGFRSTDFLRRKDVWSGCLVALATVVVLQAAFPLHNSYVDWYSRIQSEMRYGSRPLEDLVVYAVPLSKIVQPGQMWYLGCGLMGALMLALANTYPGYMQSRGDRSLLVAIAVLGTALFAVAVSTNSEWIRHFLHALNPAARVYGRALGLVIPLLLLLLAKALQPIWDVGRARALVAASLLFVFIIDLAPRTAPTTTDLAKYLTIAHDEVRKLNVGEQVIADFSPMRSVSYQAYASVVDAALTRQRTGIVLPCRDPRFFATFLYYGGSAILDKVDSPFGCGTNPGWAEHTSSKVEYPDGSRVWLLDPGAITETPKSVFSHMAPVHLYANQMWFPMVYFDLTGGWEALKGRGADLLGYRYVWRRDGFKESQYECAKSPNLNPVVLAQDDTKRSIAWFLGKPVYKAMQPLGCDGIQAPMRAGHYDLTIEVFGDVGAVRTELKVDVATI